MAGKKIQAAEIIIKTTDGGSFKVTGKEAEKLTKKMDRLGGASQSTDRRIKGVTQQSSNATKNFSKQAQTMQGGIVAVYATIAAQVFAVSAAFQFLKSSMETRNLIEGQKAFGSVTGVAYKTLTSNIQEATQGMLGFKEAASAGAIGVAAGLSATQLGKLGTAATNASLALGRDLTDSFNRLIRGVTKAEPELLDELGIILRLENATNKYAVSVGKTREQLNAFERTQAVLNDVLEQADSKYGMIQEKMDPSAFAMGQFTKEMDDIVLAFQELVIKGLLPFLTFFKENSTALVAAIGLFVMPIVKSLLPNLNEAMKTSAERSTKSFRIMKKSFSQAGDAATDAFGSLRGGGLTAEDSQKFFEKKKGVKTSAQGDTGAVLNKRQIAAFRRGEEKKLGIWRNLSRRKRAELRQHLNQQEAMLNRSTVKQVNLVRFGDKAIRASKKLTAASVAASYALMSKAAAMSAKLMNKAMMAAGVLGMFAMLVQGVMSLYNWFRDLDPVMKKSREETKKVAEANKTLNEELERMVDVRTTDYLLDLKGAVEQTGNALQSADITAKIRSYNKELLKGADVSGFIKMAENLTVLAPELEELYELMKDGTYISQAQAVQFQNLAAAYINASQASKQFSQSQQALNKSLDKQVRKFQQLPFQDLLTASKGFTGGLKDTLGITGEKGFDPDAVNLDADGKRIKSRSGYGGTFDKFGFMGQAQVRQTARDKRMEELNAVPEKTQIKYGSGHNKRTYNINNAAGELMDEDIFARQLTEGLGGGRSGRYKLEEGSNLYEIIMKQYHAERDILEEKKKIGKESKDDLRTEQYYLELLRQQTALEGKVGTLQDDTVEFSATALTNRKTMADLAKGELGTENKRKMLATKVLQLTDSNNKANLEKQAAELAHASNLEKAKGALLAFEIKGTDTLKYDKKQILQGEKETNEAYEERLRALLVENDLSVDALKASDLSVKNATQEELIIQAQNQLKEQRINLEDRLLEYTDKQTNLIRQQKLDTMAIAQAEILRKNAMRTTTDAAGTYGTQRTARMGELDTQIGVQESMQTNTTAGLKATGADTSKLGASGFFEGANLNMKQEEYNKLKMQELNIENALAKLRGQKQVLLDEESGATMQGVLDKKQQELGFLREQVFSLNPAVATYNAFVLEAKQKKIPLDEKTLENLKQQAMEMESLKIETELMSGIQNTLSNGFVSMFQTMVDGTKSFKEGMKDLAKSVLSDLAAMFAKAAALKIMMAMFPGMGNMMEGISQIPGMGRYGGEMTKYRGGGVAQGPDSGYMAMLHGREAVVPLGNDRSIPVDMRGMSSGGNTVTVNISMNGQGQGSSQVTGDGMQGLGRSIGNMVQQHLQQEMRPGGLLNQQGTKGRS